MPSSGWIEAERRASFIRTAAALARDLGPGGVEASEICRLTGSEEPDFYELFDSAPDCLRQGIDDAHDRLLAPIRAADGRGEWLPETAWALAGFYAAIVADPLSAELALVHSYGVDRRRAVRAIDADVAELSRLIGHGRSAAAHLGSVLPPPITEQFYSHMVLGTAGENLRRGTLDRLAEEAATVAFLVGAAYLGTKETARILGERGQRP
jgi:hypothetical protein